MASCLNRSSRCSRPIGTTVRPTTGSCTARIRMAIDDSGSPTSTFSHGASSQNTTPIAKVSSSEKENAALIWSRDRSGFCTIAAATPS